MKIATVPLSVRRSCHKFINRLWTLSQQVHSVFFRPAPSIMITNSKSKSDRHHDAGEGSLRNNQAVSLKTASLWIFLRIAHIRVTEAAKIRRRLKLLQRTRTLPKNIKLRLFLVCVSSKLLYGCKIWALPEAASRLIDKFWYEKSRNIFESCWVRMRDQRITIEKCEDARSSRLEGS